MSEGDTRTAFESSPELDAMNVILRPATPADAEEIAALYLASRKTFLPYAPLAHTDEEVREFFTKTLVPSGRVTVAATADGLAGMVAISRDNPFNWIRHFYLHPSAVGRGIGTRLLKHAIATLGPPIRLSTFQANTGARRFYERHGFAAIAFSDGSTNEEKCPDVLYEFNPDAAVPPARM
jgi:GNAT superfamily N-acetyltransferase